MGIMYGKNGAGRPIDPTKSFQLKGDTAVLAMMIQHLSERIELLEKNIKEHIDSVADELTVALGPDIMADSEVVDYES